MKKLRVLHLTHPSLVPPESIEGLTPKEVSAFKTDWDVVSTLRELGHEVRSIGVEDELRPIRLAVRSFKPHVVFNLVEAFAGLPELDQHVVSYLELLRVPYTGCNPRGLVLARGKALSKMLVAWHRVRAPAFKVFARNPGQVVRRPKGLPLPAIVKGLVIEASIGISQASIVHSDEELVERVRFVHESLESDAIAEAYIEGRELYVGVLGNRRLHVLPTWEMTFGNLAPGSAAIATEKVKHDLAYQKSRGIETGPAQGLPERVAERIGELSKRIYRALGLDGYARLDYRLDAAGNLWFLEANPNAEIARGEEFADAAAAAGLPYPELIARIVNLGLRRSGRPAGDDGAAGAAGAATA